MTRARLVEVAVGAVPDIHAAHRMAFPPELRRMTALSWASIAVASALAFVAVLVAWLVDSWLHAASAASCLVPHQHIQVLTSSTADAASCSNSGDSEPCH